MTENTFKGKFGPKNSNYQFKLEFGAKNNSDMQKSMVMFTFFFFERKYNFSANLVPKLKFIAEREIWYLD